MRPLNRAGYGSNWWNSSTFQDRSQGDCYYQQAGRMYRILFYCSREENSWAVEVVVHGWVALRYGAGKINKENWARKNVKGGEGGGWKDSILQASLRRHLRVFARFYNSPATRGWLYDEWKSSMGMASNCWQRESTQRNYFYAVHFAPVYSLSLSRVVNAWRYGFWDKPWYSTAKSWKQKSQFPSFPLLSIVALK